MSRIAAPNHVGRHDLGGVPPGHRFLLYLPLWNSSWRIDEGAKDEGAKRDALGRCCSLGDAAPLLDALRERQLAHAAALPASQRFVVDAVASSPFATGLGNEHPAENGFAFLTPYGLPYLAGSGVKGVVRRALQDLVAEGARGIDPSYIDAMFGPEDPTADGSGPTLRDEQRRRGALTFWDVYPKPEDGRLCIEVMTPHQTLYYQGDESPHDAGQPTPIVFLALPARSKLRFVVTFEPTLAPANRASTDWQAVLDAAFSRAFDWLGFGAKTAIGYGAMEPDPIARGQRERAVAEAMARAEASRIAAERDRRRSKLTPNQRAIEDFIDAMHQRSDQLRGNKEKPNAESHQRAQKLAKQAHEGADWTADERRAAADAIERWLPKVVQLPGVKDALKKLKLRALRGES